MSIATQSKPVAASVSGAAPAITVNPERLSGQSVIATSRVPVGVILDYVDRVALRQDFPSISEEQLASAIQQMKEWAEDGLLGARVNS